MSSFLQPREGFAHGISKVLAILLVGALSVFEADCEDSRSKDGIPEHILTEPQIQNGAREKVAKFKILQEVKWDSVYIRELFYDGPGAFDYTVDFWAMKPVVIGGISFPPKVQVVGKGVIYRVLGKNLGKVAGIGVCGQIGIHAESLDVFEIKLCKDVQLPEGIIPAGSIIGFFGRAPTAGLKFTDIRCLIVGGGTTLKGKKVQKGAEITPNYEDWTTDKGSCLLSGY